MHQEILVDAGASKPGGDAAEEVLLAPRQKVRKPPLYKVVLLNDDFTPMDFVVETLKEIFHKNHEEAVTLMLRIHQQGAAVCGLYTRDVAETKVQAVHRRARLEGHPLQCIIERE